MSLFTRDLEVLLFVATMQPAGCRAIAARSGLAPSTVHWALRSLLAAELVARGNFGVIDPRTHEYVLTDKGRFALLEIGRQISQVTNTG